MNDTVKIRNYSRGRPRIGPWVLVGDDCAAILRQSLRQISDLGGL